MNKRIISIEITGGENPNVLVHWGRDQGCQDELANNIAEALTPGIAQVLSQVLGPGITEIGNGNTREEAEASCLPIEALNQKPVNA